MEQETKYTLPDEATADRIWEDAMKGKYGEIIHPETVKMFAVYYDTADQALRANNVTIRVRKENESSFATLKWGGHPAMNGLFEHQEINVPLGSSENVKDIPREVFEQSLDGQRMETLLEGKELLPLVQTDITRRRLKVYTGTGIAELSVDQGRVIGGEKEEAVSELEIELYAGSLEDVLELTDTIAAEYALIPENRSKYARAIALLDE